MSISDKILLTLAFILIVISIQYKKQEVCNVPVCPLPPKVIIPDVPIPAPNKPELKNNILYNEYDKAISLSIEYKKNLVLIFVSDWCQYCKDLKQDTPIITEFKKYIVCFINITNKSLIKEYNIKNLPTSIMLSNQKEISRKSGYNEQEYRKWLSSDQYGGK